MVAHYVLLCRNVPHTAQAYVAPHHSGDAARKMPKIGGGDICARCGKTVYLAEKKQAAGQVKYNVMYTIVRSRFEWGTNKTKFLTDFQSFHALCFTCGVCNKKLDSTTLTEKDGEVFCKGERPRQCAIQRLLSVACFLLFQRATARTLDRKVTAMDRAQEHCR